MARALPCACSVRYHGLGRPAGLCRRGWALAHLEFLQALLEIHHISLSLGRNVLLVDLRDRDRQIRDAGVLPHHRIFQYLRLDIHHSLETDESVCLGRLEILLLDEQLLVGRRKRNSRS